MATVNTTGSGNNSATFNVLATETTIPNTLWASLSSITNERIKGFLDKTYTDLPAFLTAAADAGLTVNVVAGTAAAPATFWTCGAGAKPVLNFAAFPAGNGHIRISLAYSAAQ